MDILYLSLQIKNVLCERWNIDQSLLCNTYLSLILGYLDTDHSNIIFYAFDIHLGCSKYVLLNVRLFVKNTKLIISINKLYASNITIFTGLFILLTQTLHISLKRYDDHVQFFNFISILIYKLFFLFFFQVIFV